jgi:ribosomal protein S18 acetylase RimI-like enzyme
MDVNIRRAKREDLPAILGLVRGLAAFEKKADAVTATLEIYQEVFDSGLITCDVACVDDIVVGMTLYYDTFSTWKGKMMYLEDFYVKPEYRSQRIGSKLFDELIAESKRRACILIKWQVLDWNVEAIRFYKSKNAEIETEWYNGKLWLN